jgi:two-component system OmpR family sensor kinase
VSGLPIRLRMTAAFALAMAAVLAGTALFLYLRLGSHLSTALDRELRVRAQDLAVVAGDPHTSLARAADSRFVEHGESYAQLLAPDGRVLEATIPLGRTPLLDARQIAAARRRAIYLDKHSVPGLDEPSRLLATSVGRGVLVVGATKQDRAETLAAFRDELLIAGPIALLLASAAGYLLAGLALRPVESMRRRAAAISAETPGERLPVPRTGDELERLGETLNEMLDRLQGALERERGFVADAGHELRTPLTILRTELELALRQAGSVEELKDAIRRSAHEVDRLSQLAEDLLLIARSEDGRLPLRVERVDVDELFAGVLRRFGLRAQGEGKRVSASPTQTAVQGDRIRLEQALVNLVDNALRYGGETVTLAATAANGSLELHVRDDGVGFSEEFLARAFERFSRADSARTRGGAGLGLAIVRTIAEAHGGSAHATNRARGADVWLDLPDQPGS